MVLVANLLDLQDVKHQLRLSDAEVAARADELQALLDQAEDIILGLCNTTEYRRGITATWTYATVPLSVKAMILKQVAYMSQYRGDEDKSQEDDGLAPGVKGLSWFTRDPVIA